MENKNRKMGFWMHELQLLEKMSIRYDVKRADVHNDMLKILSYKKIFNVMKIFGKRIGKQRTLKTEVVKCALNVPLGVNWAT